MKKIVFAVLVLFGLSMFGCKPKTQELIVHYYDNEQLIKDETFIDNIELLYDYKKEGYSFIGWYLDKELETPFSYLNINDYFKLGEMNVYAKLSEVEEDYCIISYYDGETLITSERNVNTITLYNYSKEGYTFECWCVDDALTTPYDSYMDPLLFIAKEINLYAKLSENISDLTVNYYDGETLIETKVYKDNTIQLIEYSKDGYTFGGWYLDNEYKSAYDEAKVSEYFALKTMNLYAKMERIMNDYQIEIIGKIDEENYVVNPMFMWTDENGDSSYIVSLVLDDEVVDAKEVNTTKHQFNGFLNANSNYIFKVKGKTSGHETSISFKTVSEYDASVRTITLDNPYSDYMVIQRRTVNKISGIGPKSQLLRLSIGTEDLFVVSDSDGRFEFELAAREANFTPIDIILSNGVNANKTLYQVLFGDVYLFAGQSNMQWPTINSDYQQSDIEKLGTATVRFFTQNVSTSTTKKDYCDNGRWFIPTANNVNGYSAICTMTGALLGDAVKDECPIGILSAYQGDTNIANWMGPEFYFGTTSTKHLHYNAMVYPLRHMTISGVVWYQGCNNSGAGNDYKDLLLDLFDNYRSLFNKEDLDFYVIGLACYDGDSGNNYDFSYVRESQAMACAEDSHAYFISSCDNGDPTYIHPAAKHYICERVAKSILSTVYNKNYLAEGPTYKSHSVNGNTVTVYFDNADGLYANGTITNFLVAGEDGKYFEANAQVVDNTIVASSTRVLNPVYVKYGFGKSPFVNVFNKDDYSMVPFRTDNYNMNIDLFNYDTIRYYTYHPDGSDMEVIAEGDHLYIHKENDGRTYGSVRYEKWGSIIYQPQGFQFSLKGSNSNASIAIRFIEGSDEIWSYKIVDNFNELKTFTIPVTDFTVSYNKQNNIMETQKIKYIELMIEAPGAVDIDLYECRFIEMERTAPYPFTIANATENDQSVVVSINKALFAESFTLEVYENGQDTPIYTNTSTNTVYTIDKTLFEVGKAYKIYAKATNELGETNAKNNGLSFYLKDDSQLIICNFDFENQEGLDGFISSGKLKIHSGLHCILDDTKGVRVNSDGKGWQYFIFVLEAGASSGMNSLEFYGDFTNYKGSRIVIQLYLTGGSLYNHTLDLSSQKEGIYSINFNQFLTGGTPYSTGIIQQVMFNFDDYTTNGTSYFYMDNVRLVK